MQHTLATHGTYVRTHPHPALPHPLLTNVNHLPCRAPDGSQIEIIVLVNVSQLPLAAGPPLTEGQLDHLTVVLEPSALSDYLPIGRAENVKHCRAEMEGQVKHVVDALSSGFSSPFKLVPENCVPYMLQPTEKPPLQCVLQRVGGAKSA